MVDHVHVYFFFGDETFASANDGEFFVYGGLVLSDAQVVEVHHLVQDAREELDLTAEQRIKFTHNEKPEDVTSADWVSIKSEMLERLVDLEATLIAYFIHHDVVKNKDTQTRNRWAIEPIFYRFQRFLVEQTEYGMAVLDNIEEKELQRLDIARLNAEGIRYGEESDPVPLDRLVGISRSHVDWNHCLSANDVVLGSFGYCINNPEHDVAEEMMRPISRLLWHIEKEGVRYVADRGLIRRPSVIKSTSIRERYSLLDGHLDRLLNL